MMHVHPILIFSLLATIAISGCTPEARPLPTEKAIEDLDRAQQPPLYQLLYDVPALPSFGQRQQRVRILIWLRHLALSDSQLGRLDELRLLSDDRRSRIEQAEKAAAARWEGEETKIYDKIWSALGAGQAVDASSMAPFSHELKEMRSRIRGRKRNVKHPRSRRLRD